MPSADAASSSAEAKPPPPAAKAEAPDPRYVPTCAVGDIVVVSVRQRVQCRGFRAKVLLVLTGDNKAADQSADGEKMLPSPSTATTARRRRRLSRTRDILLRPRRSCSADAEAKAEPEDKEVKKPKKPKEFSTLNEWFAEAMEGVP